LLDASRAMDWFTGPSMFVSSASLVLVGVLITLGVRYLESRSRREEEAARLQLALTQALARDTTLAGRAVVPLVSVPARGPARVELVGLVGSRDVREAAVQLIEREGLRLGESFRVIVNLQVGDVVRRPA
jgi:hypothetical protein